MTSPVTSTPREFGELPLEVQPKLLQVLEANPLLVEHLELGLTAVVAVEDVPVSGRRPPQ